MRGVEAQRQSRAQEHLMLNGSDERVGIQQ